MALREELIRLKKEKDLTTEELARLSGVPKGTINKLLNGETTQPRMATIRMLAGALDVTADELCGMERETEAPAQSIETGLKWDFSFIMPDDSMLGARIQKGDTVLISDIAPSDGQPAAVTIDGGITLRRIYHAESGIILVSENPAFPPVMLYGADADNLEILGTAIGFFAPL